jgi:broad specificity phosphatase PhoE
LINDSKSFIFQINNNDKLNIIEKLIFIVLFYDEKYFFNFIKLFSDFEFKYFQNEEYLKNLMIIQKISKYFFNYNFMNCIYKDNLNIFSQIKDNLINILKLIKKNIQKFIFNTNIFFNLFNIKLFFYLLQNLYINEDFSLLNNIEPKKNLLRIFILFDDIFNNVKKEKFDMNNLIELDTEHPIKNYINDYYFIKYQNKKLFIDKFDYSSEKDYFEIFNNENKINFDFNKQDYFFCCTYCFKITKEKNLKYLGLITPNILRNDHIIVKDNNNKMLDPSKRNNRFLVVMRHGERIDNLPEIRKKQELPNYDPELTFEGMQQAINIGTQLRNLLRYKFNIEINEINIFNSPSARTLQTGILAAGALDYLDKIEKIIRIITDLNETSVRGGFENNKKESPIYYYKDKDKNWNDLYNKYINSLIKDRNYRYSKMDFSSILGKEPLEDPEIMQKRAENVITNIKGYIESTYEQDCNTLSIVATHQLNVSMIVEFLIKEINKERKEKNMDVINLTDQSFGYCCSYIFKIDENNEFSYIGLLNPNVFDSFEYNLI